MVDRSESGGPVRKKNNLLNWNFSILISIQVCLPNLKFLTCIIFNLNKGCTFDNIDLLGGDLTLEEGRKGVRAENQDACSFECKKRLRCKFWSFVAPLEVNCYLKSSFGEKRQFQRAVSGAIDNFTCELLETHVRLSSTTPIGESILQLHNHLSVLLACIHCLLIFFIFYFSLHGFLIVEVLLLFLDCEMVDTNFRGGELNGGQGFETEGHWVCSRMCLESPKCTHWTYVSKWRVNCYLKSGQECRKKRLTDTYLEHTAGNVVKTNCRP